MAKSANSFSFVTEILTATRTQRKSPWLRVAHSDTEIWLLKWGHPQFTAQIRKLTTNTCFPVSNKEVVEREASSLNSGLGKWLVSG